MAVEVHTAVCWDLDGTLLHAGPLGMEVVRGAFAEVTGLVAAVDLPLAGRTDWLIGEVLLEHALADDGLPVAERDRVAADDTVGPRLMAAIADGWDGREAELAGVAVAMPGVREALDAVAAELGVVQTVATGNVPRSARVKLDAVGLAGPPLDLELAGYGDRPGPRVGILHAARERLVRRYGPDVRLVVVGDTPRDVEAAHAAGGVAVAVATGPVGVDALTAAGADVVLADLTDPAPLVAAVRPATSRELRDGRSARARPRTG